MITVWLLYQSFTIGIDEINALRQAGEGVTNPALPLSRT